MVQCHDIFISCCFFHLAKTASQITQRSMSLIYQNSCVICDAVFTLQEACIEENLSRLFFYCRKTASENADDVDIPLVQTTIALPALAVEHLPLLVDLDLPAYGNVRQGMPVAYNIYNKTSYDQEIDVSMESSDSFMFCGQKQVRVESWLSFSLTGIISYHHIILNTEPCFVLAAAYKQPLCILFNFMRHIQQGIFFAFSFTFAYCRMASIS